MNNSLSNRRFLITGCMGCIGAWTVAHLLERGASVVGFDASPDRKRLLLVNSPESLEQAVFVKGDLRSFDEVLTVIREQRITDVIHLAALQVPFCRADPVAGAQVNVVGTVNIFEAARQCDLRHLVHASSVAVYGGPEEYDTASIAHDAPFLPHTLYGVYKQAGEGIARVYWEEHGLSSTALRPHSVYGVGRDQGITSDPTKAMLAAASGTSFEIAFSNELQLQYAPDVAIQFVEAALDPREGFEGFNLGGESVTMARLIGMIREIAPTADLRHAATVLPFAGACDGAALERRFPETRHTALRDGVKATIERFRALIDAGVLG